MTTIATDGKTMAADSLMTGNGEILGTFRKIHRCKNGSIAGSAGTPFNSVLFNEWLDNQEGEKPKLTDNFSGLVLTSEGKVFYYNEHLIPVEYIAPMTVGSGGDLALGAIPAQAVGIAMQRDTRTGGDIQVEAPGC